MGTARHPRWRAAVVATTAAVGLAGCLTGCLADGRTADGSLGGSQTCVSWVGFDTPADAAADAELVVTARVEGRDGTQALLGVEARAYTVVVTGVPVAVPAAGDVPRGRLRVISTPVTCTGDDDYPDGDPLDTDATVALFLTRDPAAGHWRTLTPFHGVVPVTATGELPADWPGDVP